MIVECVDLKIGISGQAEAPATIVDLCATVGGYPEIVAGRDRVVQTDRRPFVGVLLRSEEQFPGNVADAPDARGKVGRLVFGKCQRGDLKRECERDRDRDGPSTKQTQVYVALAH